MSLVTIMSVAGALTGVCIIAAGLLNHSGNNLGARIGMGIVAVVLSILGPLLLRQYDDGAEVQTVVREQPLAALSNVTKIEGSGGLYGMRITETDSYEVVVAHPDGSFTLERIDAAGVRIVEGTDPGDARIEVTRCERADERGVFLFGQWCGQPVTTVHIPTGTIARDFTIDPARG